MDPSVEEQTGIYIAYPTSPILKSIYRPKNYKIMVNDQHTKVGIAKDSFAARRKGYHGNFDNEVKFIQISKIHPADLMRAEELVLSEIRKVYAWVGRAREWFDTPNCQRIISIVTTTLAASGVKHEYID